MCRSFRHLISSWFDDRKIHESASPPCLVQFWWWFCPNITFPSFAGSRTFVWLYKIPMSVNNITVWSSRTFDSTVGCVAAGSPIIEILARVLGPERNTVFLLVKTLNNGGNAKRYSGRRRPHWDATSLYRVAITPSFFSPFWCWI